MPPKKVILDTNLWISHLISNRLIQLDALLADKRVRLLFSDQLLEEFILVAQRPKFSRYFSTEDIQDLLAVFDSYGEIVEVYSKVDICRDPKDNFLLALAKDSRADFLITGDNDLLVLKQFEDTQILTFTDFINLIAE
jgi:putative PIN family toxin of toxin-antitoxin system